MKIKNQYIDLTFKARNATEEQIDRFVYLKLETMIYLMFVSPILAGYSCKSGLTDTDI